MSSQTLKDLFYELTNEPTIVAFSGTRSFYKNPVSEQSQTYIVYSAKPKKRDSVSEFRIFQIACFSKDSLELEDLASAVIDYFESKRSMNGNSYYSISLVNQNDPDIKLKNGFYYSILTFDFRQTT